MKKFLSTILCLIIVLSLAACSSNNTQQSSSNPVITESYTENGNQETLLFNGVNYPINSSLDFEVKDMEYEENNDVTYVTFYNVNFDANRDADVSIDNVFESVTFIYMGNYSDICNSNTKILGSFKIYNRSTEREELIESYEIIYDEKCNMIIKCDSYLPCFGCYEDYYNSDYEKIATLYESDEDIGVKWLDSHGQVIDKNGLYPLLENLCPNEHLKNIATDF